nr:hypothetical protein Q903MT_gene5855 [Picea sitchensis]
MFNTSKVWAIQRLSWGKIYGVMYLSPWPYSIPPISYRSDTSQYVKETLRARRSDLGTLKYLPGPSWVDGFKIE